MSFSQISSVLAHANFNAYIGSAEFEQLLREEGIDPNSAEQINGSARMGWTLFNDAAFKENLAVIKYLLKHGAKIDQADADGKTALIWASGLGHIGVVQYLLKKGANTENIISDERYSVTSLTALHWAAKNGHKEVAELLVNAGADIDKENAAKQTPYELAFRNGHKKLAEWIASKGESLSLIWKAATAINDEQADKISKDPSLCDNYNLTTVMPRARRYKQLLLKKSGLVQLYTR